MRLVYHGFELERTWKLCEWSVKLAYLLYIEVCILFKINIRNTQQLLFSSH